MSRSNYIEDYAADPWELNRWRGIVATAVRGRRGQTLLRALVDALDALPEPKLIRDELETAAGVCALGAVGRARGLNLAALDPHDYDALAVAFDVAPTLVREIEYENDERRPFVTPEERWRAMRAWAVRHLRDGSRT